MGPSGGGQVSDIFDAGIGDGLTFLQNIEGLWGVSPKVQLYCEPWGHVDHSDVNCDCISSDRTAAYVHDLVLMPWECLPVSEVEDASVHTGESGARMSRAYSMGVGRPAGIGAVCISYARHLWPPAPGCLGTVEDWLVGVI